MVKRLQENHTLSLPPLLLDRPMIPIADSPTGLLPVGSPSGTLRFFPGPLPASCLAFQDSSQVYCSPSHTRPQNNLKRTLSHSLVYPGAYQAFPDFPPPPAATSFHSSFPFCTFCNCGLCSYLAPVTSHVFQVQVHILRFHSKLPQILRNVHFLESACPPHSLCRPDSSCVVGLCSTPAVT